MSNDNIILKNKEEEINNKGLITKIWGPALWETLHIITFGYSINPTNEEREQYKQFFLNLGNIIPCKMCRESYMELIISNEGTILTDIVFQNKETLTKWLYNLHNTINDKIGIYYDITYEDIVKKYESYRTVCTQTKDKCIMPINLKMISYKNSKYRPAPIITNEIAYKFKNYALLRNINIEEILNLITNISHKEKLWGKRDKMCWEIIEKMRENGILSIEKEGEYKGLPTRDELKLISLLCSNICKCDIDIIINKLDKYNNK